MGVVWLLGTWVVCAALGKLLAESSRRRQPGPGWFLALGPLALALTVYGLHHDRLVLASDPSPGALSVGIDVPCEALVGGSWHAARLLSFRTLDEHWQGYAAVPGTAWSAPAWYDREHLRPAERAAS